MHLGRRAERTGTYRQYIFYVVPGLEQHGQYPVGLAAGLLGYTLRDFLLYHAHDFGHPVPVFEYLEEDLRRDVVWEVPYYAVLPAEDVVDVQLEVVGLVEPALHSGKMGQQVVYRLSVKFHQLQVYVVPFEQIACEDSRAGSYLQNVPHAAGAESPDDAAGYAPVGQEVLAEGFLGADFHITSGRAFRRACLRVRGMRHRPDASSAPPVPRHRRFP